MMGLRSRAAFVCAALTGLVTAARAIGAVQPPPACGTSTVQVSNLNPVTIPTGPAVVTSQITINNVGGVIWDLTLQTFITHTFSGDLAITLMSPSGTIVTITRHHGGGRNDVYDGTVWTDRADPGGQVPYTSNSALVTDHLFATDGVVSPLAPQEPLGAFRGEDPNGTWTLTISDDNALDGGSLDKWSMAIQMLSTAPGRRSFGAVFGPNQTTIGSGPSVYTTTTDVSGYDIGPSICDMVVDTQLLHPACGDAQITLQSPSGTVVTLSSGNGGNNGDVFYTTH